MSEKSIFKKYLVFEVRLLVILIITISCTSQPNIEEKNYLNVQGIPKLIPNHIATTSSSNNFFFGDIADVKFLESGKIIVLDDQSLSLHLFSSEGEHVNEFNIKGRGPGEVQNLSHRLRTSSNNVIAIDDYMMFKISRYRIIETGFVHISDISLGAPIGDFFLLNDDKLVLKKQSVPYEDENNDLIQILDVKDINEYETLQNFPAQEGMTLSAQFGGLSMAIKSTTEYHTSNTFCVNENRLFYVRTDTLGFRVYDLNNGDEIFSSIYDQEQMRITYEEKEAVVDSLLDGGSEFWGEKERDRLISEMPEYKPIIKSVKCDLPNGIWLEIMNSDEEAWLLLSSEGKINGLFTNELEGNLINFSNGFIYLSHINSAGDIELKIYDYSVENSI